MYYAPNLQQIQHGQPELGRPNIDVPPTQQPMWPASKPTKQDKRIHVSLNNDWGMAIRQPLPSRISSGDNRYQQLSPHLDAQNLHIKNVTHQIVTPPASIDKNSLYSCNIIEQLQGSYQMQSSNGLVELSVILPTVSEQENQYARVHRLTSDGKALPDQFIYDDAFLFTLKSADGKPECIMKKGSNMKTFVKWENWNDNSCIVWQRKGKVTFNFVQVEPKVRRNSLSSVCTVSTGPIYAQSIDSMFGSDDNSLLIRPELRKNIVLGRPSDMYCRAENLQSTSNYFGVGLASSSEDEMFEQIKAYCAKNPILFQKVVDWGIKNNPARRLAEDVTKTLSEGRVWITARIPNGGKGEATVNSLDDIKGAYQKDNLGVWKQPDPEMCGSGVQHKLTKDGRGLWAIEGSDTLSEGWYMRAQQQQDGRWIDLKNNKMVICVNIVPMSRILERLGEHIIASKHDLEKSLDFLFKSCNHAKLSTLKGRNLKHHIANLKVKLEKRYALRLGIKVANIALSIALE